MFKQSTGTKSVIIRLDKEMFYTVDADKKQYSEMPFSELETKMKSAGDEMNSKMAEMKKKLESMPPEQRKMVEKMMGDRLSDSGKTPAVEVTKSTEKKTISGFPCVKYVITSDGKEFGTIWTTTAIPEFSTMKDEFMSLSQRLASLSPVNGKQLSAGLKKIQGFPIETDLSSMTTIVTKISKQAIPAGEFEIPAGYTRVNQAGN